MIVLEPGDVFVSHDGYTARLPVSGVIALANAALPDSDPRKITRDIIEKMQWTAILARENIRRTYGDEETWGNTPRTLAACADHARAFADALESYLPPPT